MGPLRNKCLYKNLRRDIKVHKRQVRKNSRVLKESQILNVPQVLNDSQVLNIPQVHNDPYVLNNPHVNPQVLDNYSVARPNNGKVLPESSRLLKEQQLLEVQMSELEFVQSLPKKRFPAGRKRASQPSEKRKRAFEIVQSQKKQKCDLTISSLSQLSSTLVLESCLSETTLVKESHSTQTEPVPAEALEVYARVGRLLEDVNCVIESYFYNGENTDHTYSLRMTKVNGDLSFKEPVTTKQRNSCVRYLRRMKIYALDLEQSITKAEKYLELLQSILDTVPVYSNCVQKMKKKLDKARISFLAKPVHNDLKTAFHQIKLVDILVKKFDKLQSVTNMIIKIPLNFL